MSKGSKRRPSFIRDIEYSLRHDLAFGYISRNTFCRKMKQLRKTDEEMKSHVENAVRSTLR